MYLVDRMELKRGKWVLVKTLKFDTIEGAMYCYNSARMGYSNPYLMYTYPRKAGE